MSNDNNYFLQRKVKVLSKIDEILKKLPHFVTEYFVGNNLNKEKTLVTSTSGNFGISLSCICAYLKQKLIVVMPEGFQNKKRIMESFGTEVIETKKVDGMKGTIKKIKEFIKNV